MWYYPDMESIPHYKIWLLLKPGWSSKDFKLIWTQFQSASRDTFHILLPLPLKGSKCQNITSANSKGNVVGSGSGDYLQRQFFSCSTLDFVKKTENVAPAKGCIRNSAASNSFITKQGQNDRASFRCRIFCSALANAAATTWNWDNIRLVCVSLHSISATCVPCVHTKRQHVTSCVSTLMV